MAVSIYDQQSFAQYAPRSTQEIWAPLQYMREQHDKLDEEYQQTSTLANAGFGNLDPTIDKAAIDKNKAYMDELRKASDDLATKGFIDAGRRSNINKLRAMYQTEVAPLQQAMQVRAQRAEEYRKLKLEHPDWIGGFDANKISLEDVIKTPSKLNYSGIKGQLLQQDTAQQLQHAAKAMETDPVLGKHVGEFKQILRSHDGASIKELEQGILMNNKFDHNTKNAMINLIHGTIENTLSKYGVDKMFANSPEDYSKAWEYAASGAASALGSDKIQIIDNDMAKWREQQRELKSQDFNNKFINRQSLQVPEIIGDKQFSLNSEALKYLNSGKYVRSSDKKFDTLRAIEKQKIQDENEFKVLDKIKPKGIPDYSTWSKESNSETRNMLRYKYPEYLKKIERIEAQHMLRGSSGGSYSKMKGVDLSGLSYDYKMSKGIEDYASKHKITNIEDIKQKLNADNSSRSKLSEIRFYDDDDNVAKENLLRQATSDTGIAKKIKDITGKEPGDLLNDPKEFKKVRFGYSARNGINVIYGGGSNPKDLKVGSVGYEITGNPNLVRHKTTNELYEKAYKQTLTMKDMINNGYIAKDNRPNSPTFGKYVSTMAGNPNNPNENVFTESEIKDGLENPKVAKYLNTLAVGADRDAAAFVWSHNKSEATKF